MAGAFQRSAFQNNAFQVDGAGGGSRKMLPGLFDQAIEDQRRKIKPVRPIWDRPKVVETPVEPAPTVAPAQTDAKAPVLPTGPADISNIARLFDPPVPIQVEPPARTARSRLAEAGDTAKAQAVIVTLARGNLADDADHAEASGFVVTLGSAHLVEQDRSLVPIDGFGALVDTDTGFASAASLICARAEAREDPDVLHAHATWDDDDIALALLMLADDE